MSKDQPHPLVRRLADFWDLWYQYRYYILLAALMIMLILPAFTHGNESIIWSFSRTLVLLACINVLRDVNQNIVLVVIIGLVATGSEWLSVFNLDSRYSYILGFLLFSFFVVMISYEVFKEIITSKKIDMHIIVGAFCGFMLIGIIASLVFYFLHLDNPESFSNVAPKFGAVEDLFYFSFITILTIGYGDIAPITDEARSLALFFGLIGQFYLVVIMAVLVGKFIGSSEV